MTPHNALKTKRNGRPTSLTVAALRPRTSGLKMTEYARSRGAIDRVLAYLLLVPVLPMTVLACLLVRLTSRGPAIYRQQRLGLHQRVFTLYKIRTMRIDAENGTGPVWAKPNDPRITPLGRILRHLHLDELPQLFNVVRGEMALIGPRPERPEIAETLATEIDDYMERYEILPGITGLTQLNLPPDSDKNSVRRKLLLDLEYAATCGYWLDLRIALCTAARLMGFRFEFTKHLFRLHRDARLPEDLSVPAEKGPAVVPIGARVGSPKGNGHAGGNGRNSSRRKVEKPR
jgi:lipopolysaccharide/colanic/teichoic acid biosynthesis glycosyltransferase